MENRTKVKGFMGDFESFFITLHKNGLFLTILYLSGGYQENNS